MPNDIVYHGVVRSNLEQFVSLYMQLSVELKGL